MNTRANKVTTVKIQSLDNNWSSNLEVVIVPSITSLQPSRYFATNGLNIPKNIKLADPAFNRPQKIDMLIGASHFFELLSVGQIKLGNIADSMILQKTTLGWIVAGNLPLIAHSFCISTGEQNTLNDTLKSFWELEEVQSKPLTSRSEEESQCENHFIANTIRNHEGRYVVKLPFQEPSSTLGTSFEMALHRFHSLERKFGRDPKLHLDYSQFINKYIELGHLEEVEPYIVSKIPNKFFLPHHAVMKEESSTTKLRVVFDGSAKSSVGKSINDILMVGPTIQDDLFSQLFRFRLHKHVLCADIAKMYRQVLVDKQDTNYQYILWRNNPSEDIKYFRLSTVTYRTSPASFLAIRSLVQLAKDEGARFPLGAKAILNDFYVDNLMTGADNIDDLKSIKEQTHALLALGGFPLRKWCSNTPTLLHGIPLEDLEQILEINDSPFIKTLEVKWNPNDDAFFYTYTSNESKKRPITKRTVLSDIGKFFDPLGLLNPVVVSAKLLLQHLWKLKLNWDESLPQELHSKWTTFLLEMSHLNTLQIPRYVMHFNNNYSDFQIHGFSDASEKAYGAAIYLRITDDNGKIFVHLLCSKSRVAPTNTVSLPRLELCGALLLSELLHRIIPLFKTPINTIFCWTDSTITLSWINSQSYQWKTFIANRITKIHDLTKSYSWRYVPTRYNPADLVSRGASAKDLATSNLWFNGPNFLLNSHDSWPANKYSVKELPEQKEQKFTFAAFTNQEDLISINKFANSYFRLISVFAYVLRFISKCRPNSQECNRKNRDTNIIMNSILLRPDELEGSLQALIRMVQSIHFPEEQAKLNSKQQIKSSSNLIKLSPFIDSEGIIRVGGRLRNADLNFESKHPIVLPSNHSFTRAIIWYYHIHHHHPACQTLLNILRQKYWILSGKRAVNGEIRKCVTCFRALPASTQQIMGNLPADRVTCSRPFAITGVDYCGPFYIRSGIRGKTAIKSYVAVFVCFSTRATHLELVTDLSTKAFIMALKRFISRRGKCTKLYSDNGTNFRGANNELRQLHQLFMSEEHNKQMNEACIQENIDWKFSPPRSPHFGGLFEAAVKIAKHHLVRILANASLTFQELATLLCEIEAVMNSRPLSPMSSDPNDLQPLTPGHFLIGAPLVHICEPSLLECNPKRLDRYQHLVFLQQQFWKRWQREVLNQLHLRNKWTIPCKNVRVGDLVLLHEENLPTLKWPLGRILETYPGEDGLVRVVLVKTSKGIYKRAITRICLLPDDIQGAD